MFHQVVIISMMLILVLVGTGTRVVSLNPRILFVGLAALSFLAVGINSFKSQQTRQLLLSQADVGWLSLICLTGISVIVAPFPRRSLEIWLLSVGLQLPFAYVTLFSLRRYWKERAIYRGILAVGGYLYLVGTVTTVAYIVQALQARADGVYLAPFRLWTVLDNPNIIAMFVAITVPCIVSYAFTVLKRPERIIIFVWLVGAAITMIASGSRSGAIALFAGVGVSLVLSLLSHPRQPLRRFQQWAAENTRQASIFMVMSIGGVIIGLLVIFYVLSNAPSHANSSDRLELYQTALRSLSMYSLTGQGSGGFILAQQQQHSIPPFLMVPHAHNMILNVAADNGLFGLAGLLIFIVVMVRISFVSWQTQPLRRPMLAGAIGGLIGFFVSGLLDSPMSQPGLFYLASVLFMFIVAGTPLPTKASLWRASLIALPMAAIIIASAVLLARYSDLWRIVYTDAITLSDDAKFVQVGAAKLDALTSQDPADPLVRLQAAYAWAQVASHSTNSVALPTGIQRLEEAIPLDPYLGLHYLNLSVLYTDAGRHADALRAAHQAVTISSEDPVAWLNLGQRLETAGETQSAQDAYAKALTLQPRWSLSPFWQSSESRQVAFSTYKATAMTSTRQLYELIAAGDKAHSDKDSIRASQLYHEALAKARDQSTQTLIEGLVAWNEGDLTLARAKFVDTISMSDASFWKPDAWGYLGMIAAERGDQAELIAAYNNLYILITSRGIGGLETAKSITYANSSFWRFGLVSDYLPQVTILDVTTPQIDALKVLAKSKVTNGDLYGAQQVYRVIAQSNPLDTEAHDALLTLNP